MMRLSLPRTSALAMLFGLVFAGVAIGLRLLVPSATGGEQAIFSFPAIIIATLLFGAPAGTVAAIICFLALWYFVIPPVHSFAITTTTAAISLLLYIVVATTLVTTISAMRRALARARAATEQLQTLLDRRTEERDRMWRGSRELVAVVAEDGTIEACNPALSRLLGAGPRPRLTDLLAEDDRPAFEAARQSLAAGERQASFEARLCVNDETLWIAWTAEADHACTFLVGHDFTAVQEYRERLHQSQKMEFVGQMTGGLAHDFANLLSPIGMTLDLLRRRHGHDAPTAGLIDSANESTTRAAFLIRRLLRFARPETVEPTAASLRTLVEQVEPLLSQVAGSRHLHVRVPRDLPTVSVDVNEFEMALLNLVANARDAMEPGDHMMLTAEPLPGGQVAVTLSDSGRGMDAETLANATRPFFSTKGQEGGTGLGLPMVQTFAANAGGRLELESRPGEGTTARLILPAGDQPTKRRKRPALAGQGE